MKKTIAILFALILVGCTTANKDYTEYKISFGKKCSKRQYTIFLCLVY